jgi:hypothetical protein
VAARKFISVLAVLAWALWMGGFTFFTSVTLRVGHKVLENYSEFGFVTQMVTDRLNVIGLVAVFLLILHLASHWRLLSPVPRIWLATSWSILAITLGVMFWQHNQIDALIDLQQRTVTDHQTFNVIHSHYKMTATFQWIAAVSYLVVMLLNPVGRPAVQE